LRKVTYIKGNRLLFSYLMVTFVQIARSFAGQRFEGASLCPVTPVTFFRRPNFWLLVRIHAGATRQRAEIILMASAARRGEKILDTV